MIKSQIKIVVLYKVWSGEEWLEASVDSIAPFVEKVILLTSSVSWIGGKENPSLLAIQRVVKKYGADKVEYINHDEPDQLKHCMMGFDYIKKHIPCDFIQLIDSDELWDEKEYCKAVAFLEQHPNYMAYRTQMYTYLKSPFYRVDPPEPLKPVCFISPKRDDMGLEPRGCGIKPFIIMPDVWCHHFVFVRSHFNKVLEKLIQSHVSEKQRYSDMSIYIPECWNKLPNWNRELFPNGCHPAIGFQHNWKSLIKIPFEELPEILKQPEFKHILEFGKV